MLDVAAALVAVVLFTAVFARSTVNTFAVIPSLRDLYQRLGQALSSKSLPDYAELTGFPAPIPIYDFDVDSAKPRPYRPFRWEYHQNMSLKKLEPDWWIELESTYRERIAQRKKLYVEHGKLVIDELPGSQEAQRELVEMVIQYICQRYPNQFQYNNWTGVFSNNILGIEVDINTVHPLVFLLDHVPEDFLITQEDPETGLYVLRAAVSCSAVGWNIGQKMGRPLHQIHGPVPDYKEKMAFSMDRFFSKMPCDKPIQRGSWGLEVGEPLFLQTDEAEWSVRQAQDQDLPLSNIYMRVDWQTLRRMPKSRAIVFNFKALFTPLTDFQREPYVPKLLLKVLTEGKKSIMEYKGTWHIEHKVIPALREWAKEQGDKGLVPKDWKERTLDEDPFYPGWKDHYPMHA
ncbi:hypothetical protein HYDPIDRAFT_98330 [Hydnomerulius pinastri MD-312]|uniref:Alpha-1,2-mannosyltransferase n=1 Tax=Hydnomerulius pinastri MD-312 TaxID=994086 RepID=A0A0C9V521_9AGAM|nr:hypothetical protein HYDPIDRAFT_98330 [Hydnomerulius pinastri MD-312]